jgi:tetratricopeptide (TPR) repeat protein
MLGPHKLQIPPPDEWTDFQNLTRDLTAARLKGAMVQNLGRSGQAQYGVDHFSVMPGGGVLGVQCKKKDVLVGHKLTVLELLAEVGKAKSFTPKLTRYVVTTTSMDDAKLQMEAAKLTQQHARKGLFEVWVEGWNTIRDLLGTHTQVSQKYYGYPPALSPMTFALEGKPPMSKQASQVKPAGQASPSSKPPPVLSPRVHHALGLLVAIGVPLTKAHLARLVPAVDWAPALRELSQAGLVSSRSEGYEVPQPTRRSFFRTADDRRPFDEEWATILAPLAVHVDTGILLAGVLMRLGQTSQSIAVLAALAEVVEPGPWTTAVLRILLVFDKKEFLRSLPPDDRLSLLCAGAMCLSHTNRFEEARTWAARLRKEAVAAGKSWYQAEADLLTGIVFDREGDTTRAVDCFRKAADFAKNHRHHLLQGHALNNLAMMLTRSDPTAAELVLEDSLKAKRRAGESRTGVSTLIGFGLAAANAGRHLEARRSFLKAVKLAGRTDDRYGRAMAECNVGAASLDLGEAAEALLHYRAAKRIAEKEQFPDPLPLAARGIALALSQLRRHKQAEKAFRECYDIESSAGNTLGAAISLHDLGASQLYQGRHAEARKTMRQASRLARTEGDADWLLRCLADEALCHRDEGNLGAAATLLERRFADAKAGKDFPVAAALAETVAALWADVPGRGTSVEAAFLEALRCWRRAAEIPDGLWRCLGRVFDWRWKTGRFEPALEVLREMVAAAEKHGLREELVRSLDQLGSCLQQLNRHAEAESLHRRALKLARKLGHEELVQHTLNNLGELYRHLDRGPKAEGLYKECEAFARNRGDPEAAIATAHNRALLLCDTGRRAAGRKLLRRCLEEARSGKFWAEYVRAIRGVADIAQEDGNTTDAIRGYRRAIAEAEKHGLEEHLWPARSNLAGLLLTAGKMTEAIGELEACEPSFAAEPDGFRFTAFLARCYRDARRHDEADAAWERAASQAAAAGDEETVLAATAELAKSLARRNGFRSGNDALRAAVRSKTPATRVVLARAGIELSVEYREFDTAGRWFKILVGAVDGTVHREDVVDAHMLFGDGLWSAEEHRGLAVQAFVAGQSEAASLSQQAFSDAGLHLLWKLLGLQKAEREELERETEAWLRGPGPDAKLTDGARFVLWPFRVARQVGETEGVPRATVERRVLRAISREFH